MDEKMNPKSEIRKSTISELDDSVVSMPEFFDGIAKIVEQARTHIERSVNVAMCVTYYEVGRLIVEQEQSGANRAAYGKKLLDELSAYLTERCGKGWSVGNLKNARQFYQVYSPSIRQSLISESEIGQLLPAQFVLSWTHYLILMRIKDADSRRFYEIEAASQQWTVRQLKRQIDSSLYERLALSRDKDEVMRLAIEGQTMEKPRDMLKSPLVLEFLDLEQNSAYSESDLELAIIANLQKFLLELGKGFLFEARQKRFAFDEKSFFVDLVFYNRLLQCYVLIDLKTGELHHQDLGQMQMYVNYFDRYVKKDFEKPSVGILLCQEKNDNIVELTLPQDSNIYASEYSLYLPDKALLQRKLAEWTAEFEETHGGNGE
ncbi:MAG: PDDEXK nuclease domain-containing protein [Gracilibacteraceae bacterium]|nr:PDDEXK nuclease domain-containing protein [Gracilibacteraceae bacterium]